MKHMCKLALLLTSFFCIGMPVTALSEPFTAGLTALGREHATTAYRAWMKVAEKGDAEGQNNVGFLYERGLGVSQDYKQAEAWYMMASDQGLPSAKHNLAMLTYKGHINNKDWRKSVEWLKEADQMDFSPSTYMLGVLYMRGEGIFKDREVAFDLFKKAAKLGEARGQYMVGYIHQSGMLHPDEESDYERGYLWSAIALMNGFEKARSVMIKASLRMSDEKEASLIKLAETCIASAYKECEIS
jgi:TPR repeat protein